MKKNTDFDEFLKQLEYAMNNIMDELEKKGGVALPEDRSVNINISINVFPVMNMNRGQGQVAVKAPARTPVDIIETENNIHAVIRIPDMEQETIKLDNKGKILEISALSGNDTVSEIIELPAKVNKRGMKSTYKNGILEVVLNKPRRPGKAAT